MHNAAFKALGIDAEYSLFEIPNEKEVEAFLRSIGSSGYDGFNVTVPYKSKFITEIPNSYRCSPEGVLDIGAVNTIVREGRDYRGHNTDWYGFLKALETDLTFDPQGKRVLLIGAGGAGKACLYALVKSKAREIVITDIDPARAEALKRHYVTKQSSLEKVLTVIPAQDLCRGIKDRDLIVNASNCGMRNSDPELIPERYFKTTKACVYDLIYNPSETKLLKAAKASGLKVANGLTMLLYQGVRAFELWTGAKAPVEQMRKALHQQLKK
jgi:shikimate dehydrogenase